MIQNAKLDSGLELVHYSLPHTRFVEIALAVGVGTRYESAQMNGISHFVEHILFRGCRLLPTSYQLNLEFDRIGEGLNAMTYKELTLFTTKVPSEELARALKLLAGVVSEPLFRDVDTEREIIREEILEELDEKGRDSDIENISRRLIFGSHELARPVLGRPETIARIGEEQLMEFHDAYYHPANMVLSVAGGVPWSRVRQAAQEAFGRRFVRTTTERSHGRQEIRRPPELHIDGLKAGLHFVRDSGSQVEVLLSFFMPGERHAGELARGFLARVLDDGISSRLQRTVCERRGLLYDISSGIEAFVDVALFDVQFSVSPQKLSEVVEVVVAELELLATELVGEEEFEIIRGRYCRDIQATAENAGGMATMMAEAFALRLAAPLDPREHEARVRELTPRIVRDEAARAFRFDRCAFLAKGPVTPGQKEKVRRILRKLRG